MRTQASSPPLAKVEGSTKTRAETAPKWAFLIAVRVEAALETSYT
jgi:hypothetical protein